MIPCLIPRYAAAPPVRKARGFTFIELMLTVGLVAVLVAVALPAYSGYRTRVNVSAATQDITVMSLVIQNHRLDHGSYPDSLAEVGLDGKADPWGRPYQYYNVEDNGIGHARKDHALNPINTDFDLYSVGPDGQTKKQVSQKDSVDDVIRGRNGAFIGVASDF